MLQKFAWLRAHKIWGVSLTTAALFCGGLYWYLRPQPEVQRPRAAAQPQVDARIGTEARIIRTVFYDKCRESKSVTAQPKKTEIGLTYREFQQQYPAWNIEQFSPAQVVMSYREDAYCEAHRQNLFVGIYGERVAVFYGKPGEKPILKEVTDISLAALHPQAAEEIRRGIAVHSKEELLRVLEALHSK